MASYNKFNAFVADQNNKVHNLGSDTLKLMLSNVAPTATNAVKTDITEISAGNGYVAGGAAVTVTGSTQTGGTYTLAANPVSWTASGGAIATFRYVVLYNSTTGSGNLISWWDVGAATTINSGFTFTVTFSGNDIFTES